MFDHAQRWRRGRRGYRGSVPSLTLVNSQSCLPTQSLPRSAPLPYLEKSTVLITKSASTKQEEETPQCPNPVLMTKVYHERQEGYSSFW